MKYEVQVSFKVLKQDGSVFAEETARFPGFDYAELCEFERALLKFGNGLLDAGLAAHCDSKKTPAE